MKFQTFSLLEGNKLRVILATEVFDIMKDLGNVQRTTGDFQVLVGRFFTKMKISRKGHRSSSQF